MSTTTCPVKSHAVLAVAEDGRILTMDKHSLVAIIRPVLNFELTSRVSKDAIEKQRMCIRFHEEVVWVSDELLAQRVDAFQAVTRLGQSTYQHKHPGARRKMSFGDDNMGLLGLGR